LPRIVIYFIIFCVLFLVVGLFSFVNISLRLVEKAVGCFVPVNRLDGKIILRCQAGRLALTPTQLYCVLSRCMQRNILYPCNYVPFAKIMVHRQFVGRFFVSDINVRQARIIVTLVKFWSFLYAFWLQLDFLFHFSSCSAWCSIGMWM